MKKMIVAFLMMPSLFFSLVQEQALAQDCIQTVLRGAATTALGIYEQKCLTLNYSEGVVTKDVQYNCCGPSATIRINANDWELLRKAGKLDGLRYQKVTVGDNSRTVEFKKITNDTPSLIDGKDFFK